MKTTDTIEETAVEAPDIDHHGIVVGVDGGPAAEKALAWAAAHTDRFGPVRPVHAWDYPLSSFAPAPFGPGVAPPLAEMEAAANEAASSYAGALEAIEHEEVIVRRGDPGIVLVEVAHDANLLVVGTRGRGPLRANVIGSVGRHCADHTPVPLVIVPVEHEARSQNESVVVGVDGSESSREALRWAVDNASTSATITAVAAWQTPVDGPILYGLQRFDLRALKAAARATVRKAADEVCADLGIDGDRIVREISEGDPRWVLQRRSDDADLLVLGQRGRSGLSHFFLGSTTTALVHRPHCPTAVIPSPHE